MDRVTEGMNPTKVLNLCTWLALVPFSIVMLSAASGDLWLDEIWSLSFARDAESVSDLFFLFQHDNSHILNTLFLYFVGEQEHPVVYRGLSVLSGMGSLWLAGHVARRDWGPMEALGSTLLVGISFPLLLYFSEARGYALAIFLALASYAILGPCPSRCGRKRIVLFWSISALGILAHASFVMLSVAFAMWSLVEEIRIGGRPGPAARRIVALHGVPGLVFAWWYLFFLRDMEVGGGPEQGLWSVLGQASVLLLGLPDAPVFRNTAPFLCLLTVVAGSMVLYRRQDARWSFFPAAIVVAPALVILAADPPFLYFRHFIVCFPFMLLLLALLVVRGWHASSTTVRWSAMAVLAMLLAGQVPRDWRLLALGRGQYAAALGSIVAESPDGVILVGSDHDFRNRMLVEFHAPRVPGGEGLRYVSRPHLRKTPPDWLITHSLDTSKTPDRTLILEGIGTYRLTMEYGFSGISGWAWFLFRRVE
jgi:hypothetical protein